MPPRESTRRSGVIAVTRPPFGPKLPSTSTITSSARLGHPHVDPAPGADLDHRRVRPHAAGHDVAVRRVRHRPAVGERRHEPDPIRIGQGDVHDHALGIGRDPGHTGDLQAADLACGELRRRPADPVAAVQQPVRHDTGEAGTVRWAPPVPNQPAMSAITWVGPSELTMRIFPPAPTRASTRFGTGSALSMLRFDVVGTAP